MPLTESDVLTVLIVANDTTYATEIVAPRLRDKGFVVELAPPDESAEAVYARALPCAVMLVLDPAWSMKPPLSVHAFLTATTGISIAVLAARVTTKILRYANSYGASLILTKDVYDIDKFATRVRHHERSRPAIVKRRLRRMRQTIPMTDRQAQILELSALGYTHDEIGELIGVARGTIKAHLEAVRTRAEVRTIDDLRDFLRSAPSLRDPDRMREHLCRSEECSEDSWQPPGGGFQ